MKKKIAEKSRQEGYRRSRLPEFTEEEVKYIRGKRYQSNRISQIYLNFSIILLKTLQVKYCQTPANYLWIAKQKSHFKTLIFFQCMFLSHSVKDGILPKYSLNIQGNSKRWTQLKSKRYLNTRQTVGCGIPSTLLALRVDLRGLRSKLS